MENAAKPKPMQINYCKYSTANKVWIQVNRASDAIRHIINVTVKTHTENTQTTR